MARKKRVCKYCGKEIPPYKERRQNYCSGCARQRQIDNWEGLITKRGPAYEKWRAAYLRGIERARRVI